MVAAAHLKPINDPKKTDLASTSAHLFQADGSRIQPHDPTAHIARSALAGVDASALTSVPTSAPEFQRDWRRHPTAAEKVGFLRSLTPAALVSIFRVEINGSILADILLALADGGGAEGDMELAVACMRELTKGGRFDLNVRLLGGKGKAAAKRLLEAARGGGGAEEEVRELAHRYTVNLD